MSCHIINTIHVIFEHLFIAKDYFVCIKANLNLYSLPLLFVLLDENKIPSRKEKK